MAIAKTTTNTASSKSTNNKSAIRSVSESSNQAGKQREGNNNTTVTETTTNKNNSSSLVSDIDGSFAQNNFQFSPASFGSTASLDQNLNNTLSNFVKATSNKPWLRTGAQSLPQNTIGGAATNTNETTRSHYGPSLDQASNSIPNFSPGPSFGPSNQFNHNHEVNRSFNHYSPNTSGIDPLLKAGSEKPDNLSVMSSASSNQIAHAGSRYGADFTHKFTSMIKQGYSLKDAMQTLDGKAINGAGQTPRLTGAKDKIPDISIDNPLEKGKGIAIIHRGAGGAESHMMDKDANNMESALKKLGYDVKVTHTEKQLEEAIKQAKEAGEKQDGDSLFVYGVSHGNLTQKNGPGHNSNDKWVFQGKDGGHHEDDFMGDIAYAAKAFDSVHLSLETCHSGACDADQYAKANGYDGSQESNEDFTQAQDQLNQDRNQDAEIT